MRIRWVLPLFLLTPALADTITAFQFMGTGFSQTLSDFFGGAFQVDTTTGAILPDTVDFDSAYGDWHTYIGSGPVTPGPSHEELVAARLLSGNSTGSR
jgi:hypothetical protein